MSQKVLPVVVSVALAALGAGCGGAAPKAAAPSAGRAENATVGDAMLDVSDLPDGYEVSPPDAEPEVSTASSASVPGCEALLDYLQGGAQFQAGTSGPFLDEELADGSAAADLAGRCARFTDTDADGTTTAVTVAPVEGFPAVGADERAFSLTAGGGQGDDAFTIGGYLVAFRIGGTTCTIVHFGQPGVDRGETETIARAAGDKIRRRQ